MGAACDARSWGGADELAAFPLRVNSAQTASASQITKCVCPAAHAPTPAPALLGAASRGGERVPLGCCFAATPGVGYALRAADETGTIALASRAQRRTIRPSEAMARMEPHPLLTVPRSAGPGVSACRRTRASLSSLPQLFERSSKNAASSAAHPRHEHRRLPPRPRARGTRAAGSPFLGLRSFGEAKEGRCAAGRTPRPPPSVKANGNHRQQATSTPKQECANGSTHAASHSPSTTA